jgi:thymidylate kinase
MAGCEVLRECPNPCGLWVALLGPDGAGKSAVIKRMSGKLSIAFDGIQEFHFRPRFQSCRHDQPAVTQPHAQPPRSALISSLKLLYWLADCWFGYLGIVRPARAHSQLVIFDRYYNDILVDPRRYRLPNSCLWISRMLVRLAPQPDLYVLLDVPAEIVQQRKDEVSGEESRRQQQAYRRMFHCLSNALIVDGTSPLDDVAHQVSAFILDWPTNRTINAPSRSAIAGL